MGAAWGGESITWHLLMLCVMLVHSSGVYVPKRPQQFFGCHCPLPRAYIVCRLSISAYPRYLLTEKR